jgi:phosphonoacetaldehyde hydrolase
MGGVATAWREYHGRAPGDGDVDALYQRFIPLQKALIRSHSTLINGTVDAVAYFRSKGLKIGSTTGYSREMMDVLVPLAREQGYEPDAIVCPADVPAGRPAPYMTWANAVRLGLYPPSCLVKIGDTVADIEEGLNAGAWTIGLTGCGNELGLSQAEADALSPAELEQRLAAAEARFLAAGAHFVAPSLIEAIPVIGWINQRLAEGGRP